MCRTSDKQSISIKRDWLLKNREEAFAMGKDYNAVVFDFGENTKRYYIVDENTFVEMKEALDNAQI